MRAHHIRLVAIIFFLASILNSCSESTSPSTPTEIVPLKEGNRWIYSISQYDSVHTLEWTILDTIQIGAPTVRDGKTWYPYLDITSRLNTTVDTLFYRNESDGLWATKYLRSFSFTPYQIYKYPAANGDIFNAFLSYSDDSLELYKFYDQVAGSQEIIYSPAGTFSCIRYEEHSQMLNRVSMDVLQDYINSQSYVAPGIGLIKSIQYYYRATGALEYTQEMVLVSYRF